jgi:FkbM family methyltransferase
MNVAYESTKSLVSNSPTGDYSEHSQFADGRFISAAQNFEDVMLWRALGDIQGGLYIDVGACDPVAESVTWAFYNRGWRGINVEPVKANWQRLFEGRPRDVNIHAALGSKDGTGSLFLVDGGNGLSTLCEEIARKNALEGRKVEPVPTQITTLAKVCRDHISSTIHFLKIDAEGFEKQVVLGGDFERFRPWIMLIEAPTPHNPKGPYLEWEELLIEARYRFAYFDGLNCFYVAEEQWDRLSPAFATPPNVFDGFVRITELEAVAAEKEKTTLAIAERDSFEQQLIAAHKEVATEKERVVRAIAERDSFEQQLIAAHKEELATEKERVVRAIAERDSFEQQLIAAHKELAAEKERAVRASAERDSLEQQLYEVDRTAAWLGRERQKLIFHNAELKRTNEELSRANEELSRANEELSRANEELSRANAALASDFDAWRNRLYRSASWRITGPLRRIARALGRR